MNELKGQGRGFEIVEETLPPAPVEERPTVPVTGMDLMFEKAWSCVNNENVGIIGIYGIGGVGKSTLLKRINNEFLHRRTIQFDVVIWVVVSKEVNVKKIQDDVANRVVSDSDWKKLKDESLDVRASKLHSVLSKKRFMLFLDDVWEAVDLIAVGIPHPDLINGSKIVFTARSEDVCGQMEARTKIRVDCLEWLQAWKLFQEKVGEEALNAHPEIRAIAEDVAKECAGLPLALITIGRAMACKKTHQEWRDAVRILKNSASKFSGMEKNVYSTLKLSYDNLEDDTIKSCFLYCSMFPEDHSIEIEQLVRYWIGEGLLDFDDRNDAENRGYAIIEILKRACLLESGLYSPTKEVKMNDVLRDLALWIGCDGGRKLLVQAGVQLAEAPKVGKWREAERISLMDNNLKTLGEEAPKCPKLLSLILSSNYYLENICNGFFQYMHVLRVLDLSYTRINVLPTSIVELVELEYLGLKGTHITQLPQEIKSLVKLKCLDLSYTCYLTFIPCGILSSFSKLQVLDLIGSNFVHWEAESGDIGQDEGNVGASIEELGRLGDLQHLSIRITNVASLNIIVGSEKLARCTRGLSITKCEQLAPVILNYRSLSNIRDVVIENCKFKDLSWLGVNPEKLKVDHCEGLQQLCDGTGGCFTNLTRLNIWHCDALKDLSLLRRSTNLEFLEISHCNGLRVGITGGCFPKLDYVEINECKALKDLSWLRGAERLHVLTIRNCGLQKICDGMAGCFPKLCKMDIEGCNSLKDLSLLCGASNLEELVVSKCKCLELICDSAAGSFLNLHEVDIEDCDALKDLSWLCGAPNLEKLSVSGCECLELICDGTARCFPNLRKVFIMGCNALKDLSWLCGAPYLEELSVVDCKCRELICNGMTGNFPNLYEVNIEDCNALKDLSWLCGAPNLGKLFVRDCECLELICDGTAGCFPNPCVVTIYDCNALKNLSWLCGASNLEELSVMDCKCLELICHDTVGCFPNLHKVELICLPELKCIPRRAIPPCTRTTIIDCRKATPPDEPKHLESNEIIRKRKRKFKMKSKAGEAGFGDASGKS